MEDHPDSLQLHNNIVRYVMLEHPDKKFDGGFFKAILALRMCIPKKKSR